MPLPNFSDSIEKNIIRHIKYRGTIRTGEITARNTDETYDVKIAMSDQSYPDVETLYPDSIFQVGEIVTLAFEYGSKEIPKIIGHGKKVAQDPVDVEVDYSGIARVETLNAYLITSITAYLEARIALGGAGNCTTRGFQYGTTTAYGDEKDEDGSYGDGSYAIQITSLTGNTTYHFRAYIIDENDDTIYGDDKTFVAGQRIYNADVLPTVDALVWVYIGSGGQVESYFSSISNGILTITTDDTNKYCHYSRGDSVDFNSGFSTTFKLKVDSTGTHVNAYFLFQIRDGTQNEESIIRIYKSYINYNSAVGSYTKLCDFDSTNAYHVYRFAISGTTTTFYIDDINKGSFSVIDHTVGNDVRWGMGDGYYYGKCYIDYIQW